jgi:Bacterial Ig domain
MRYSRYVGRVGALAVALGIGAGMFAMPFVASAKPSKPDTSSSTDAASTTSTAPSAKKPKATAVGKVPVTKSVNGVIVRDTDPKNTTVAITTPGERSRAVARGAGSTTDGTNCIRCTAKVTNGGTATAAGGKKNTALTDSANTVAVESVSTAATTPTAVTPTATSSQSARQRRAARVLDNRTTQNQARVDSLSVSDEKTAQLQASLLAMRRTFFNQAPTLAPVQLSGVNTGPVAGTLGGVDPDGDTLVYVLTRRPKSGTVQINSDGTYTYAPGPGFDGVDTFRVKAIDQGLHVNLFQLLRRGSRPATSLINQGAIKFDFSYIGGAWTSERREALQDAADDLVTYLRVTSPVVLTYKVRGFDDAQSDILASAGSRLVSARRGFWPTVVQKKLLTGVDANGFRFDGQIQWNFGNAWALGDTVGAEELDFTSTAMHELMHTFGFVSEVWEPGTNTGKNWAVFDSFIVTAGGMKPIDSHFKWNTDFDPNIEGDAGGLYFGGANAVAGYGGLVPLYTPNPFLGGSSMSHLDDATFTGANQTLMNAFADPGPGVRILSPAEVGILRDLGYQVVVPQSPPTAMAFIGLVFLGKKRRKSKSAAR